MKGKKGMARHSCSGNKEMNHTRVKDMGVCWIRGEGGGGGGGWLKDVFKITLTSSLRERQRQGQVN